MFASELLYKTSHIIVSRTGGEMEGAPEGVVRVVNGVLDHCNSKDRVIRQTTKGDEARVESLEESSGQAKPRSKRTNRRPVRKMFHAVGLGAQPSQRARGILLTSAKRSAPSKPVNGPTGGNDTWRGPELAIGEG
jgi:hypothetical protein